MKIHVIPEPVRSWVHGIHVLLVSVACLIVIFIPFTLVAEIVKRLEPPSWLETLARIVAIGYWVLLVPFVLGRWARTSSLLKRTS